jgi:hypothetical protein
MLRSIWIGYDPKEADAFLVARQSIKRHLSTDVPVHALVLDELKAGGLYTRPTELRTNAAGHPQTWDLISQHWQSTEFANSRFLVPHLAKTGWAAFVDSDILVRGDFNLAFDAADPRFAVMCVKHRHHSAATIKMDGQVQANYSRKNWSSVMLFNCDHPANRELTVDLVNTLPGRDLHRFCWLDDGEIGELSPEWNWLAGEQPPLDNPMVVHHTLGSPCMPGYENAPYADEWRAVLAEARRAA